MSFLTTRRWLGRLAPAACALSTLLSCAPERRSLQGLPSAEFGIFYGGQVQEREQIPFELDHTRQTHGFRLVLDPAPRTPLEVRWEVGTPGRGRPQRDSRGRIARPRKVQLGRALWRGGEAVFEQATPFAPGDPLGLWSIRVLVGDRAVLDRSFWVYDALEHARLAPKPFEPDAGP